MVYKDRELLPLGFLLALFISRFVERYGGYV
jgi:hypothetical protein